MGLIGYYFIIHYFPSSSLRGKTRRALTWIQALLILNLLIALTGVHSFSVKASLVSVSLFGLCAIAISLRVWHQGHASGFHFFMAWIGLISSTVLLSLNKAGIIPRNFWTENSLKFGIISEVVILSYALSEQIRAERLSTSQQQLELEQKKRSAHRAKLIQEALIRRPEEESGLNFELLYQAADNTGGDWCSAFYSEKLDRLYVFIGDVTGHGLPAAIITSMVATAIDSGIHLLDQYDPCSRSKALNFLAERTNDLVFKTGSRSGRNMTMGFICIDLASRQGTYLNAGHNEFYFIKRDGVRAMIRPGSILGFGREPQFKTTDFEYEKGDLLLGFTDGLIENTSKLGEKINMKQLLQNFKSQNHTPKDLINHISTTMSQTWQGHDYDDDVSLLAVQLS